MNVRRGDIVVVPFPFASGVGSKRRPALVIQNDLNNSRMANTILAAITTTTHRSGEPTQLLIDPSSSAARSSGLAFVSVISCENLMTFEQSRISRKLGALSPELLRQVDDCLKSALGII